MKTSLRILLLTALLGLAACQPAAPLPTATTTANDNTLATRPVPSPTPTEPTPMPTLPAPTAAPTMLPSPTPTAPVNCAAFPGWPGCQAAGAARLPLTGQLAWVDAASGVLTAANFAAGKVWNAPAAGVTHLAWSLDKAQLLASDKDGAMLYPAAGGNGARPLDKTALGWLPDGLLLPAGWVANTQGANAHIEVKEGRPYAKIRPGGVSSVETTFALAAEPTDQLFRLLAWLPGTDLVLGQAYFAGNAARFTGGQLFMLDAKSGALKLLEARTPLSAGVAPHPTQPGLLALVESSAGGQRLATLDALSGKLTLLTTDESVFASRPAWTPDGKSLLFAAWVLPLEAPTGAPFDLRAIYLTSPQGGPLVRLTQPAAGFVDDQPRPLAGGKFFLYIRRAAEGKSADLRLGGLEGMFDQPVVKEMLLPACQPQPACAQAVWGYAE